MDKEIEKLAVKNYVIGVVLMPIVSFDQLVSMVILHFDMPDETAKKMVWQVVFDIIRGYRKPSPEKLVEEIAKRIYEFVYRGKKHIAWENLKFVEGGNREYLDFARSLVLPEKEMEYELPPCCQPDSDCADEIRKGNPPPCAIKKSIIEQDAERRAIYLEESRKDTLKQIGLWLEKKCKGYHSHRGGTNGGFGHFGIYRSEIEDLKQGNFPTQLAACKEKNG